MPKKNPLPTTSESQTVETSVIAHNTTITITLPWSQIEPAYNQALKKLAKRVRSSGFRPGKVPPHIAADMIGQDKIKEEALKGILAPAYQAAIEKAGKKPLTQPEFNAKKVDLGSDWEIVAEIAEKPEISVKGYEKIVKKAKQEAEKAFASVDHAGHNHADPKAEGKELTAQEKAAQEKAHHDDHILQDVLKALVTELKPAIPELLIKTETRAELEQLLRSLDQFGLSFDDYLARRKITFEQLSSELASQSLSRLQIEFILGSIVDDQKLTAEESDFTEYLNRITDEKQRTQQQQDPQYMAYLTGLVLRQKATQFLLSL